MDHTHVRASEFEEVIALINQVFRAGTNQDIRTDYPLVFNHAKMEYMRILKVDGVVVAHVPVWLRETVVGDDRLRIGIISPTVTHPDYRRHGYATLCLQDCIRIMEEEGSARIRTMDAGGDVSLSISSPAGKRLNRRAGSISCARRNTTLFESGPFDIVQDDPRNADSFNAMMNFHNAEPYRIARSIEEYRALFSLPQTMTFLAMNGGEVVAYLMFGEGANKPGLIEGGGDIEGIRNASQACLVRTSHRFGNPSTFATNSIKSRTTYRGKETGERTPY